MSTRDYQWCASSDGSGAAQAYPSWHGFCAEFYVQNQWRVLGFNGVDIVAASVQTTACLCSLVYAARSKQLAKQGAPASLVLPAYVRFLYGYTFVTGYAGIVGIIQSPNKDQGPINAWLCDHLTPGVLAIAIGLDWGLFHLALEGLTFFFMQKGAGVRAFRRAGKLSLVVCTLIFITAASSAWMKFGGSQTGILTSEREMELGGSMQLGINASLLGFYSIVRFSPATCFFQRPALKGYATFWVVLRGVMMTAYALKRAEIDAAFCVEALGQDLIFACCAPIAVFMALKADSEYWRGHHRGSNKRARLGTRGHSNLNLPLAGRISMTSGAAVTLAETLDSFQGDAEIELLNFAYLDMESEHGRLEVVGAGGTAKVYRAKYKKEPVAVKLVYPPELTHDEVEGFLSEAAVLAEAGAHRNLVQTYGVCVMPPAIALVLELCDRGDLNSHLRRCGEDGLLSTPLVQLEMAMDCCAGLAWLHGVGVRASPIIHNDLKSFNVLVSTTRSEDEEGPRFVAKLADLEFGYQDESDDSSSNVQPHRVQGQSRTDQGQSSEPPAIPDTVNWTAPELMVDGSQEWPSKASDVWALGMLLFEIFALDIPLNEAQVAEDLADYNRLRNDSRTGGSMSDEAADTSEITANPVVAAAELRYGREYLIERLTDSDAPLRPPIRGTAQPRENPRGMNIPDALAPLLDKCWDTNPLRRPEAQLLEQMLRAYYEDLLRLMESALAMGERSSRRSMTAVPG